MPNFRFVLVVKPQLALLMGTLNDCFIPSRFFFEILPREAHPSTGKIRASTCPPHEQHVFLPFLYPFLNYGTAASSHNKPDFRFALFVK